MQGNQKKEDQKNQDLYQQNDLFQQVNENKYQIAQQQKAEQSQNIKQGKQAQNNKDFSRVSSSPSSSPRSESQSHQQSWQYQSMKQDEQKPQLNKDQKDQGQNKKQNQDKQKQPTKQKTHDKIIRYKYCCKKCKHADRQKDKKACVCVVPRDQRRTHLGNQGCQTCGCNGCSKQDFIYRGQDPEYHPEDKKKQNKKKQQTQNFQARNGCCKNCMKAFSKSNKSCICQVPQNVRKTKLSSAGCKICGCVGCNPEDKKYYKSQKKSRRSRSRSQKKKSKKRSRSRQKKKRSKSKSPEIIDTYAMNFHNIDRSIVGSMIINEYQIDPALLGFGIPQRSSSYLFGKTCQK